uniref:Uncharacterized protein n=3 Tax=Cacopsylla melanoneura TaxID=428564 RepID=A0A8D9EFV1_9HEMI
MKSSESTSNPITMENNKSRYSEPLWDQVPMELSKAALLRELEKSFQKDLYFENADMVEKIKKDVREVASEPACVRFLQNVNKSFEDPLIQNPNNVFQEHALQFIRDMHASDRPSSLSYYLPKVMHHCQLFYTYNDLMDNEKGVKEYFQLMSTLVLEYWKSHFLQDKIHGLEREQKMVYVALTYLYRNEGAIMDLLLKLTFWIENSKKKSQINMENLFNLIRIFYLKLVVKNPKYMSANFSNLSLLNYIRLFLLFKILKHLEAEATLATNEVTVDLKIDHIIEDFVFRQLRVHAQMSHVLPLLDRVFPETDIARFKDRVVQLLMMHEYNFFERIAGFLDFQKQHESHIDLAGNMLFTFKKVCYYLLTRVILYSLVIHFSFFSNPMTNTSKVMILFD